MILRGAATVSMCYALLPLCVLAPTTVAAARSRPVVCAAATAACCSPPGDACTKEPSALSALLLLRCRRHRIMASSWGLF